MKKTRKAFSILISMLLLFAMANMSALAKAPVKTANSTQDVYGYVAVSNNTADVPLGLNRFDLDAQTTELISTALLDTYPTQVMFAGEYVDGHIYAFTSEFGSGWRYYTFDTADYSYSYVSSNIGMHDLAYDYSTDTLFGVFGVGGDRAALYELAPETGTIIGVNEITGISASLLTLACTPDGVLYGVATGNGQLFTIDKETCEATLVGETGFAPDGTQSMTYDYNNDRLLWAYYSPTEGGGIAQVDMQTGGMTPIWEDIGEITTLYTIPETINTSYDLNGDGNENTGDAAILLRYLIGLVEEVDINLDIADVNGDGDINTGDAAFLLGLLIGA